MLLLLNGVRRIRRLLIAFNIVVDLFLRQLRTKLYRPHRAWVKNAKISLVHWLKVRDSSLNAPSF